MNLFTKIVLIALIACTTQGMASTVKPTANTTYGSWDSLSPASVPKGTSVTVFGWAADTAATPTPTTGVIAKIFVDGTLLVDVPVKENRPDVTEYYGFKNCGFTAVIDTSKMTLGVHTIEIKVGGGPSGWNNYSKPVSSKGTFTVTSTNVSGPHKPLSPAKNSPTK